ncbi:MAG: hypothetical protein JWM47_1411 [Acidimicrobiales bacterium]|nr:hypothetical protein [Acidimicrobiales bacterium]
MTTRGTRPRVIAIGLLILVVAAVAVGSRLLRRADGNDEKASLEYCLALHRPDETVKAIRGAIAGKPVDETRDLAGLQATSSLFFNARAADGAPRALEPDARRVIRAFRSSITRVSDAPLDDPRVRSSVRRLAARGDAVCDGDGG